MPYFYSCFERICIEFERFYSFIDSKIDDRVLWIVCDNPK